MEEAMTTDAELLRRIDQMAVELERLRQQLLESMAAKRERKKFKSVRESDNRGRLPPKVENKARPGH